MTTERPTQAVILAGGRGTRMRPLTDTMPKPMIPFHGKPFMGHVVDMLRQQGFERVLMLLGYLPEVITDHFGNGDAYGVRVDYAITAPDDLTAYRVQQAADLIDDVFLLLYCDNYWPMRFDEMWSQYVRSGVPAQVTIYSNRDNYTRSSVVVNDQNLVEIFDRERTTPGLQGVEVSYAILDKAAVMPLLPDHQELFEVAVYPELASRGQLGAYWSEHRYYSVGGHERLPMTERFLARHPAVFVDRDGVLNERPPRAEYVTCPEEFRWLPGAKEALARFAEAGWRVFIISNQPGIARGRMTAEDLEAVHRRMVEEAVAAGGRIDQIYHCAHGWDEGCFCRKPRPGMLFQAQREHDLDLTRMTFIGDDERDGEAAAAAGCGFAMVDETRSLLSISEEMLSNQAVGVTS